MFGTDAGNAREKQTTKRYSTETMSCAALTVLDVEAHLSLVQEPPSGGGETPSINSITPNCPVQCLICMMAMLIHTASSVLLSLSCNVALPKMFISVRLASILEL